MSGISGQIQGIQSISGLQSIQGIQGKMAPKTYQLVKTAAGVGLQTIPVFPGQKKVTVFFWIFDIVLSIFEFTKKIYR